MISEIIAVTLARIALKNASAILNGCSWENSTMRLMELQHEKRRAAPC